MKKLIMLLAAMLVIIHVPSHAQKSEEAFVVHYGKRLKEMSLREFMVYACTNARVILEEAFESKEAPLEIALDTAIFLREKNQDGYELFPNVKKYIKTHFLFAREHSKWPKVVLLAQGEKNCQESGELFPEWLREILYKKREEEKGGMSTQN